MLTEVSKNSNSLKNIVFLFATLINPYVFSQSNDCACSSTNNFSSKHSLEDIHGLNNVFYSLMDTPIDEVYRIQFVCMNMIENERVLVDSIDNSSSMLYEWIGNELDIKLRLDNSIYRIDSAITINNNILSMNCGYLLYIARIKLLDTDYFYCYCGCGSWNTTHMPMYTPIVIRIKNNIIKIFQLEGYSEGELLWKVDNNKIIFITSDSDQGIVYCNYINNEEVMTKKIENLEAIINTSIFCLNKRQFLKIKKTINDMLK